jgi:hypothetical protein
MASETLLALWNDTPTRRAIVDFVHDRAKTHDWTVVSMKEDWSAVFASA